MKCIRGSNVGGRKRLGGTLELTMQIVRSTDLVLRPGSKTTGSIDIAPGMYCKKSCGLCRRYRSGTGRWHRIPRG